MRNQTGLWVKNKIAKKKKTDAVLFLTHRLGFS